eukprot:SRR837773.24996.p3 GENE.SRR837773.24996~~SRR837773.24996.p3  ORF type:complete len:108 (-),score=20.37 SRR837773.24996:7-330(-)
MNPFLFPDEFGAVCNVTVLRADGNELFFTAIVGLAGLQVEGRLPRAANVGDLGRVLRAVQLPGPFADEAGQENLIHMVLPGEEAPVSPLDIFPALARLRDLSEPCRR